MLALSATRRQRRHTSRLLAASFAQLALPWLAPAQLRWTASHTSSASRRRRPSTDAQAKSHPRGLATSTDQYTQPSSGSSIPPPSVSHLSQHSWDFSEYANAPHFGPGQFSDPVQLDDVPRGPSPVIKILTGFSGTAQDLIAHLHTALAVGRQERAEAIIRRMAQHCALDAPELLYAHTVYLEYHLRRMANFNPGTPTAVSIHTDMQQWFDVEIKKRGTRPNVHQLIAMIRAAVKAFDGPTRDRTIRRYLATAKQQGSHIAKRVLYAEEYDTSECEIVRRAMSEAIVKPRGIPEDNPTSEVSKKIIEAVESPKTFIDLPEVLQVEQKGMGLQNVKRALNTFRELPSLPEDAPEAAKRERAYARQRRLEESSVEIAIENWQRADGELRKLGINTALQTRPMGALLWQWYQKLLVLLQAELKEVAQVLETPPDRTTDRLSYGPYLEVLAVEKLAATVILCAMSKFSNPLVGENDLYEQEVKLTQLTLSVAGAVEEEIKATRYMSARGQRRPLNSSTRDFLKRKSRESVQGKDDAKLDKTLSKAEQQQRVFATCSDWPAELKLRLGAVLVAKFVEAAEIPVTRTHPRTGEKVSQMQPAFLHRFRYVRGKKQGMLVPNSALLEKLNSEPVGGALAKRMPMIVEPLPWAGWEQGGYLRYPSPLLRLTSGDKTGRDYIFAADAKNNLDTLYKGLTALGKTPWKVNSDVFKVQLEAWNSGEAVGNLAPLKLDIERPLEPESADPAPKRVWLHELQEYENKIAGCHSKRCFQNFQMEVARTVLNETFYFPHNMDFRGRAYPIPPYLNHMGADNVRGLLQFGVGRELGPDGFRWLQIHLATVAGHDKASLEERVRFTQDHMDDIRDSVNNPLGGRKWWLEAEDAWQLLAACFDLVKAADAPDTTKYVSYLPVQQDGTCNGLQHYAALGGDRVGAAQVNLEPGDRPSDVYTAVAEAVKADVARDAQKGDPVAKMLDGKITRKCVKQPVMTNVYGVTFHGARMQVIKQLYLIFPHVKSTDPITIGMLATYVTTKIFKSLGSMFTGAQAIQHWLGLCAERISTSLSPEQIDEYLAAPPEARKPAPAKKSSKAAAASPTDADPIAEAEAELPSAKAFVPETSRMLFKSTVVWTTPLQLPVVQPYRNTKGFQVMTKMQRMFLAEPQIWDPVSKRKQLQAFPPNFIHSLDATHMLLSALKCDELGLTFASVHDSFWTHAADVSTMSSVLRDAFILMHNENIIGRLREEFTARYKGHMFLQHVPMSSEAAKAVLRFRKTNPSTRSELVLEMQRMKLLNSDDPAKRAKGAAMVTPGSIVEKFSQESASAPLPAEMVGQTLGELPGASADGEEAMADPDDDESMEQHGEEVMSGNVSAATPEDAEDDDTPPSLRRTSGKKVCVWAPMVFPKIPKKGDFDVRRLRESQYFFH